MDSGVMLRASPRAAIDASASSTARQYFRTGAFAFFPQIERFAQGVILVMESTAFDCLADEGLLIRE